MRKKGQVGMMITITISLILGIVMFQIIFSTIDEQIRTLAIIDDQFTAANDTCVQVTSSCIAPGSGVIENATNAEIATGNFTQCQVNNPGKLNGFLLNADDADPGHDGVTVNATYTERSCSFISGGTTTIVLNLLPLLFAVLLLVFVAGFIAFKK
ncbi:hypothetical protein LCGC14_1832960 [marine sediment metagenome]|uniref:Uncharacterized protein n=1 Tax=marine sediment metagenome TaxID=412755 RepID=A0A0F9JF08_9ZZZZ